VASIPLPTPKSLVEQQRNQLVNEATRFASEGCPQADVRLTETPVRVLTKLTSFARVGLWVNRERDFTVGPGGIGAPTVWVIVVEGVSAPVLPSMATTPTIRSFIFVIPAGIPEITGCAVQNGPMPTRWEAPSIYGGFDFDVILNEDW
jgi:hypothetical protein